MTGLRTIHRVAKQTRPAVTSGAPAAVGRAARAGLGALAVALLLGAAPQDAGAQACKAEGIKPETECVTARDIKTNKKNKPVIGQKHRKDETGVAFNLPPPMNQRIGTRVTPFSFSQSYAELNMKVPAAGWVMLTANAVIDAAGTANDTRGVVQCELVVSGPLFGNQPQRLEGGSFEGVINAAEGIPSDTMQQLFVFEVPKKGAFVLTVGCGILQFLGVSTNAIGDDRRQILMRTASMTAQYFPTRYCRKKRNGDCKPPPK